MDTGPREPSTWTDRPGPRGTPPARRAGGPFFAFALRRMVGLITTVAMAADDADELTRIKRERDLYRRLLDLGRQDEPEPFLREALGLIVEVTGARQGYLELHDDDQPGTARWSLAHGFTAEQLAGVRAALSRGIIAEALASGKTIITPSALLDERFRERESVRIGHIEAVLCAPIGDDPPRGVLYLQNRAGHGFCSEDDRAHAETFARHPSVTLNCATLPETLIESELFGALPGAHSTATRRIEGKVESAERGTLFLDEIGELSHAAQAKLLHLLQAKEYYPLGGTKPQRANVRVIAASNLDLQHAVAERRFREDLFYRLQVLPIRVPSLAERREDIPLLAAWFCTQACTRHGLPRLALSPNALRAAETAEWPGNVRQLENAVEAAVIRAAGAHAKQVERAQ